MGGHQANLREKKTKKTKIFFFILISIRALRRKGHGDVRARLLPRRVHFDALGAEQGQLGSCDHDVVRLCVAQKVWSAAKFGPRDGLAWFATVAAPSAAVYAHEHRSELVVPISTQNTI